MFHSILSLFKKRKELLKHKLLWLRVILAKESLMPWQRVISLAKEEKPKTREDTESSLSNKHKDLK